ncbi:hypothetical protein [Ideonella sp.]|uniref:helix-turn-helix domain-containing protein n=1 Tax=Ideonella sp. TaxID=1929293 RepID=UPI002B476156|nr:hypothetical protein [Ideonella sp.]HJV71225.1 hypothetical protein [Ideonella sp.]
MTTNSLKTFWDQTERVALTPRLQPGMLRRKAGLFAHEIARLHEAGYSLAEIQLVLSDVGLPVGKTTVAREVARLSSAARAGGSPPQIDLPAPPGPPGQTPSGPAALTPGPVSPRAAWSDSSEGSVTPARPPRAGPDKPAGLAGDPRTGMQIAGEFFSTYIANPLFKEGKK